MVSLNDHVNVCVCFEGMDMHKLCVCVCVCLSFGSAYVRPVLRNVPSQGC